MVEDIREDAPVKVPLHAIFPILNHKQHGEEWNPREEQSLESNGVGHHEDDENEHEHHHVRKLQIEDGTKCSGFFSEARKIWGTGWSNRHCTANQHRPLVCRTVMRFGQSRILCPIIGETNTPKQLMIINRFKQEENCALCQRKNQLRHQLNYLRFQRNGRLLNI